MRATHSRTRKKMPQRKIDNLGGLAALLFIFAAQGAFPMEPSHRAQMGRFQRLLNSAKINISLPTPLVEGVGTVLLLVVTVPTDTFSLKSV